MAATAETNQSALVTWTQKVWHAWMERNGGAIVNVASLGGLITDPGVGYYNVTKAAALHLTRQFAAELAPHVRVNAIAPGLVRTDMSRVLWEGGEEDVAQQIPIGRIGEPPEVANAAVFLASPLASWITGATLIVDGGFSLGR